MTEDSGWSDFGAYAGGGKALGHPTSNIHRVAKEGAMFTSWYGQSSTARRVVRRLSPDASRFARHCPSSLPRVTINGLKGNAENTWLGPEQILGGIGALYNLTM